MTHRVNITIADPSHIIRCGIASVLREIKEFRVELSEVSDVGELKNSINWQKPDLLMVNPATVGLLSLRQMKRDWEDENLKIVAITSSVVDDQSISEYNDVISIYDTPQQIKEKIEKLISEPEPDKRREELTPREKEVVSYVVEGMTNKEIADAMSLSIHTVITHRRNIAAKLDINSVAGLTIYAIVNKLVDIDEVQE